MIFVTYKNEGYMSYRLILMMKAMHQCLAYLFYSPHLLYVREQISDGLLVKLTFLVIITFDIILRYNNDVGNILNQFGHN